MSVERLWIWVGWAMLLGCLAGWPLSALWWAKDEPQFVLGLSWLALGFAGAGVLVTAQAQAKLIQHIRRVLEQGDGSPS